MKKYKDKKGIIIGITIFLVLALGGVLISILTTDNRSAKDKADIQKYIKDQYSNIEKFYEGNPTSAQISDFNVKLMEENLTVEEKYKHYAEEIDDGTNNQHPVVIAARIRLRSLSYIEDAGDKNDLRPQLIAISQLYRLSVAYMQKITDGKENEEFIEYLKDNISEAIKK